MMKNRSTAGIFSLWQAGSEMLGLPVKPGVQTMRAKPNSTSSWAMNSGGKPRAPI